MSWRNCPAQSLKPGKPLDFPTILMCHRYCLDTHYEAKGTAPCWQSLPQTQHCLFTHSSHLCFCPPPTQHTAAQLAAPGHTGPAVHSMAAGPESLIHEAAQHLLHPAERSSTDHHTVLNTLLTNFDVLQFLYKLLPCMAHGFVDHTITPSASPLSDWRVSISQVCPTQNPLPSLNFFSVLPTDHVDMP